MNTQPLASDYARSYNSFSGSDIRCTVGSKTFAELQAVSYNVHREKAPIYTLGSCDPRSFSRNKRGVAGSLIWVTFDRHALLDLIRGQNSTFFADADEVRPEFLVADVDFVGQTAIFESSAFRPSGIPLGATVDQSASFTPAVQGNKILARPWYSDQIIPFDITIMAANEYGAAMAAKLFGIEILNEGTGISIDDAVTEMNATFVARLISPMQAVTTGLASVLQA